MSKVGKKKIVIPDGVTVEVKENVVLTKGPLGELTQTVPNYFKIEQDDKELSLVFLDKNKQAEHLNFWGLYRSLISNVIIGVSKGFKKELELQGVGYRVSMKGQDVELNVGYSHPVIYKVPEGIKVSVKGEIITIEGIDKQKVGQVAAEIKSIKKPDAYKGKGLRYVGEEISVKPGKKAVGEA